MKEFIRKALVFFLFLFLLLCFFQLFVFLRTLDKSINGHDNLYQTSKQNAQIVFVGNSRCLTTWSPRCFEAKGIKVVNLGVHGQPSALFAKLRIENYLSRNNVPPDLVVFNVDGFTKTGKEPSLYMKDRFARYAFFPNKKDKNIVHYFKFSLMDMYLPGWSILRHRKFWDVCFMNNKSNWCELGFESYDENWCGCISNETIPELNDEELNLIKIEIKQFRDQLYEQGSRLLLVNLPIYYSNQKGNQNVALKIADDIGVSAFDFNTEGFNRDCALFKDYNHLNHKGAELVSDSFANICLKNFKFKKVCSPSTYCPTP